MGFKSGSVPPRSANRRAASRSTNFFTAKRMTAAFSPNPLYVRALAISSSSIDTVVRMVCSNNAH
jgi:hypothetical protein